MTLSFELIALMVGAAAGGFVQGVSGFAFGMTAMSVWVWTIDPRLAAVMTVFGGLVGQLISASTSSRRWNLKLLLPFLLGGLAGIPLGVYLLAQLDASRFKLIFGTFLLLFCSAMLLASRMKLPVLSDRAARISDALAGLLGGAMSGLGGFSGPAPALWCTLRDFSKDAHREVLQSFNLVILGVTMAVLVSAGIATWDMLPKFVAVTVAMVIPSLLGARVYLGLSQAAFRRTVLGALVLSGIAMIGKSLS